jgi:hypothetical protein
MMTIFSFSFIVREKRADEMNFFDLRLDTFPTGQTAHTLD